MFSVGGIGFLVSMPEQLSIPYEFSNFVVQKAEIKERITIKLINEPVRIDGHLFHREEGQLVYKVADGWIRCFPRFDAKDGLCTTLYLRDSGNHTLYIPQDEQSIYTVGKNLISVLAGEYLLMKNDAIILHSSVVCYKGKCVLFSGRSGVGKSTQADIWNKAFNAEIINGDRCVIAKRDDAFFGCGSPYAGSSEIFKQKEAPIAGIVFVSQGKSNRIYPVSKKEAFFRIYSQCVVNTWDASYTKKMCDFTDILIEKTPMYILSCKPELSVAELVKQQLYRG